MWIPWYSSYQLKRTTTWLLELHVIWSNFVFPQSECRCENERLFVLWCVLYAYLPLHESVVLHVDSLMQWRRNCIVNDLESRPFCFKHLICVRSRNCGCLVTWFCYQLIAKPGNKTATVPWPDPYTLITLNACRMSQVSLTVEIPVPS